MSVETITTVLVAAEAASVSAQPYDLVDLTTVRDELGITDPNKTADDAFLRRAITQASKAIASYCNRVFQAEVVQDEFYLQQYAYPWQMPAGVRRLQLSRWPLPMTNVVIFTGNTVGTTVITGVGSTAGLVAGVPLFASDGSLPSGTVIESVTASSVKVSGAASSKTSGLTFTAGVQVIQTLEGSDTQTLTYGSDYTVDAKHGWLIRLNRWTGVDERWEAIPTTVQYLGGYQSVPSDLQDACLRLVTARFHARGRDPMLVERNTSNLVGSERFWFGATPGQRGAFAPEIAALLDQYRVPVVA